MEDQQPDEIRKNAHSWNLEGDAKLLKYMQKISENVEKRCSVTKDKLNNMVLNLDFTAVELGNTINELSDLENLQFVENRIAEDDGPVFAKPETPNNIDQENSNYNPIETLTFVLKNCNKMINECFEEVSIDLEDSDDEEGTQKSIALRPKTFLQSRRAPFIIGSTEWFEKWHVGLCDSDENFSDEENNDEFSESSDSVSIEGSLPSIAPTISESECSVWGLHQRTNNYRMTSSSDDMSTNTATSKGSLEDPCSSGQQKVLSKQTKAPLFLPQDTAKDRYYIHKRKEDLFANNADDDSDGDMFDNKKPTYITHDKRISNIISDEPPELDEVDRKSKDLSNSLFYESDENSYHIQSNSKKPTGQVSNVDVSNNMETMPTTSAVRKKTVNLFDDDDFDSFMKELDTKTLQKSNAQAKETNDLINSERRKEIRNLFEDDTDDGFTPTPKKVKSVIKPVTEKSVNPGGSDIFKKETGQTHSADTLPKILTKTNIFTSESEDEHINIVKPNENREPKISLFGKENSNDMFTTEKVNKVVSPISDIKKTTILKLFDDDPSDDDFDSLFKTSNKISIKDNAESDQKATNNLHIPVTQSPRAHKENNIIKEEEDIKFDISYQKPNLIQKKTNLFDDDSDLDDIFASKVNETFETQKSDIKSSRVFDQISKNIFGEDDDNEADDFFSNVVPKSKSIPYTGDKETETRQNYNEVPTRSSISDILQSEDSLKQSISDTVLSETIENISKQNFIEPNLENIENTQIDDKEIKPSPRTEKVILEREKHIEIIDDFNNRIVKASDKDIANQEIQIIHSDREIVVADGKSKTSNVQDEQKDTGLQLTFVEDPPPDILIGKSSAPIDDVIDNSKNCHANVTPSIYDPLSFFDDIPPDDDFQTTGSEVTKRLHTIFYDDFSDTIVPEQLSISKSPSNYIFNDEPPPDNDSSLPNVSNNFEKKGGIPLPTASENIVQPMEFERKSIKKDIPTEVDVIKSKPIPKKLHTNLNINVAALLPGAKQPKFKEDKNDIAATNTTPKNISIHSDPNRLSSLNKTRAKIQVRRKPSTRKGRQDNYRKSLDANGSFLDSSDEKNVVETEDENIKKEENNNKPKLEISSSKFAEKLPDKENTSVNLLFASDYEQDADWLSTATKASTKSVPSVSNDIPVSNAQLNVDNSITTQKSAQSFKNVSIFDDQHSDDDDLFSSKFLNKKLPIKNDGSLSSSSVIVANTNEDKSNLKNQSNTFSSNENEKDLKTSPNSIFGSDDDEDEELFAKALKNAKPLKSSQFKSKEKNTKSLFDDVDDDDGDLFGNPGKAKKEGNTRPYKSTVTPRAVEKKTLNPETSNNNNPLADLLDS